MEMIRVTISTPNGKLTFECANKREANKIRTPLFRAYDIIDEANVAYEKGKVDKYEYYCRVQAAISLCSIAYTAKLTRRAKYLGNEN